MYESRPDRDSEVLITEETIRDGRAAAPPTKTEIDDGVDETNYAGWLAAQGAFTA